MNPDERAMPPEDPPEDAQVRRLLRGLPEVDPPPGFFDRLIRRRRRRARAVAATAFALAIVAGGFVVAEATGITGEVDPSLVALAERHGPVLSVETATVAGRVEGDALPAPLPQAAPGIRSACSSTGPARCARTSANSMSADQKRSGLAIDQS